ncbi:hypothetical protein RND81_04G209800 [Saponaria officinalis]|uniref:Transcription factor CBF/NF-Y/archaeal histone domain-containing protein n=1 Tax=Saponaria officinalis TaxID=3572 RepID=A0AAW1LGN8_SAPOF
MNNDEIHETNQESPENSICSKNKNNNNNNTSGSSSKEQDRFLPIANVGRIMKKVIPGNGKISKDAKETVQECVSEFISFVTGEASDKCQREKRKTINGDDIIWAITTLGFEDYVNPLKVYLNKYREIEGEKLNVPKQQRSEQLQPSSQQQQLLVQQQHEQFQQVDQGMTSYGTSVYSSPNTLLLPQTPTFHHAVDPQFSLPFSPNSMQNNYTHQEQIDSVGQW